jgi:hypothetical protein
MAIVTTTVFTGADVVAVDIAATATKDKGPVTINHRTALTASGNPPPVAAQLDVHLIPLLAEALAARWAVTQINSTQVQLTKLSTAGSANAAAQLRVRIKRPHSIGR